MAEVVHVFPGGVSVEGVTYAAQVAARAEGHLWEAWIEFLPTDGGGARRTPRETTQPDREAVAYWATGLSATYLEGAFARTRSTPPRPAAPEPAPAFDAPAASRSQPRTAVPEAAPERAILDPFSVGAKGESLLRKELGALAAWHLRNIVREYGIADPDVDLERLDHPALVERIVAAARPA